MIERKLKLCKGPCGEMKYIWAHGQCKECDAVSKGRNPGIKRTRIKHTRKITGEFGLFEEIWEERPHRCQCCNKHLGSHLIPHYFSHLLTKGSYPSLRLEKKNIMLMCWEMNGPSCHTEWENGDRTQEKFKLARLITDK